MTTQGPNRARHLFECVTMTMIEAAERLYECQRQTAVHIQHFTVSNCLVNMVSPDQYQDLRFHLIDELPRPPFSSGFATVPGTRVHIFSAMQLYPV